MAKKKEKVQESTDFVEGAVTPSEVRQPRTELPPGDKYVVTGSAGATGTYDKAALEEYLPGDLEAEDSCKYCKYWHRQQRSDFGQCRRRLLMALVPNRLTNYGPEGIFLITPENLWCGDFEKNSS